METNKELVQQGTTDATRPIAVGHDIYDPLVFQPEIIRFSRRQYVFLNAYRLGVSLPDAAAKAEMSPESAERFLRREDTVKWLQDRALMDHIRTQWEEPSKWWSMGDEVLNGQRQFSKAQIEVWKDFGRRIAPVAAEGHAQTKIEVNIDPGAVQEAFRRQQAIDAQIVDEKKSA